jgi:hypothetical protein
MSKRHHPVVDRVVGAFGNRLKRRRDFREMRELDSSEFAKVARELNVATTDLDTFVHQGPHAADELSTLLTLLGIDKDAHSTDTAACVARHDTRMCVMPSKAQV